MFTQARKVLRELLSLELWPTCEEFDAAKGYQLFAVGQKPRHMLFVATGEVVLERSGLQGAAVIWQRTRHGFISEASLHSSRYHCDRRVVAHSRMVRLPVLELRQALDRCIYAMEKQGAVQRSGSHICLL